MKDTILVPLMEAAITILKEKGKSQDLADLFIEVEVEPGLLGDILIEFSLTADPSEEVGIGCYSVDHLEKAIREIKETGTTNLLEQPKKF